MTRRTSRVDAGIALLVLAVSLVVVAAGGLGTPSPNAAVLDGWGVLLVMAASLPLAARRRAPLVTYLAVAVATGALMLLHYPLDFPFGAVLGAYTVALAYGGEARTSRRWAARLAVGLYVPAIAVVYLAKGYWDGVDATGMMFWVLSFVGAWLAGDLSRVRRERLAELEERAERAQREAERERRLAAAQERTRIARELHDSAGHAINVILVQAGAARLLHERDPRRSLEAIGTIEDVARSTVGEIDRLVRALREGDEGAPADPGALEELMEAHRAGGLRLVSDLRGGQRELPRSVAWAAYRILQEALTNAARHGGGSADVLVSFEPEAVRITVTNPTHRSAAGAPAAPAGGGHGIVGMRERAAVLGGRLDAAVEQGVFRLSALLPYRETAP